MFKKTGKAWGGGLLSAVLVLMMLAASVLPFAKSANAAGNHTITITAQEGDHNYGAYQILSGTVDSTKPQTLTGIQWGSGVDSSALLAELNGKYGTTTSDSAAEFASKISGLGASDATELSKIVTKHVTGTAKTFTKSGTAAPYTYKATGLDSGYYLVKDTDNTAAALTSPILQVVNDVSVDSKSSVPTSGKEVKEDSTGTYGKTADYEIGEVVPFKLTGTMPSNIADFTTYKYGFKDTLSKGFTLDTSSIKVTIDGKTVAAANYTVNGPTTTTDTDSKYVGGNDFSVMFTDLKAAAKAAGATLTSASKVVVEYTATVNEKAEINNDGNGNKSNVVYQKDVNSGDPTGETPEEHTWVFTYTVNTTKVDSTDNNQTLEGAEFKLLNSDKSKAAKLGADNKIAEWVDVAQGTVIKSAAGGLFDIKGLDADTYYLREITAPTGYNLPSDPDFQFVITAKHSVNAQGQGQLTELKINGTDGNLPTATVSQNIENTSGSDLPKTGGMGTALFTVAGLAVMAAAGGGIAYRRRKANA